MVINLLPPASLSDLNLLHLDSSDLMRLLVPGEWTIYSLFEKHYPCNKETDTQFSGRCSFISLLMDNGGSRKQS